MFSFNANLTDLENEEKMNWKTNPIIWCDGSSSSWGLVYDIQKNRLLNFKTNGPVVKRIDQL